MAHPKGPNRPTPYGGYHNPFTSAPAPSRIDMGVDYSGNGIGLVAIGDAHIYEADIPGWGGSGGAFIGYTLTSGPLAGKHIYYAEHITPHVSAGQSVKAGQQIATLYSNMEMGWASGAQQQTLAAALGQIPPGGQDAGLYATGCGLNYNAFIKALGGPGGLPGTQGIAPGSHGANPPNFPTSYDGIVSAAGPSQATKSTPGSPSATNANTAQAFVAELNFPSIEDEVTAIALGAEHKGLMHDQQLLPFVQQLAQGSMRSFQSLPDGSFYAFYPDYFGEFGHHNAYWLIDDIEILSGGINLTDDALATHVFAVGDNTWPVSQELINMLFSSGTINVFNAFLEPGIIPNPSSQTGGNPNPSATKGTKETGMQSVMTQEEAIQFIQRYGARPLVKNYPMVRSNVFEMLLAYQQFMYSWAMQFITPYTFTFMPELYPGGKVGFPSHGLKMYVNSVTHSFDYEEGGFTTEAELVAPSLLYPDANPTDFDLPSNMVQAMVEPIRNTVSATQKTVGQAETNVARTIERYVTHVDVGSEPGIDRLPAGSPP